MMDNGGEKKISFDVMYLIFQKLVNILNRCKN